MHLRGIALAAVALAWSSCLPCPQQRPLASPDGGVIVCTRTSDCPVEAGTLVCTQTQDRLYECIGCEAGQCVRWVPEACR